MIDNKLKLFYYQPNRNGIVSYFLLAINKQDAANKVNEYRINEYKNYYSGGLNKDYIFEPDDFEEASYGEVLENDNT